ncbi:MAG: phage virion morphogenesis protein [Thiocapsa sp.]|nr:MAG: phage virion morphogenesis protein [Thiocapsa sp.]
MAGTRITIDLDDAALQATLSNLAASVADPSPALAEIGEHLLTTTKARFGQTQKRAPDGTPGHATPRPPSRARGATIRSTRAACSKARCAGSSPRAAGRWRSAPTASMPPCSSSASPRARADAPSAAARSPGATSRRGLSWASPRTTAKPSRTS